MTESAVILIAALRADADALILVAAAEAADCIVLLARQIGKLSGLRLLLQIMNKIISIGYSLSLPARQFPLSLYFYPDLTRLSPLPV
jgi:hypothetical protein